MTAWVDLLTEQIVADRVDQGMDATNAAARAAAYARWLELLPERHDADRCALEPAIRRWRGDLGFHTGRATVLVAQQGRGKTNTCSYLIEHVLAHRLDWDVYTNIPFPWDVDPRIPRPARLHSIRAMSELLDGIFHSVLAGRKPAVAVDEMDQVAISHSWADDADESWTKFLFVERHFRVRGPLLAYHVYEHVPLPLRRVGDLRGSYFRVVVREGERRLACVEDTSRWWRVGESVLPFLTLGLRGFSIDVDMEDLESHLDGDAMQVARQGLDYLDALRRRKNENAAEDEERREHAIILREKRSARTAENQAFLERREEIIQRLLRGAKYRDLQAEFHVSSKTLANLKAIAERRAEFEGR